MIKILIVDDERHIVNHFSMLLEKEPEYTFDIMKAYSGVEALEIIKQTNVNIILLDIKMPRKSGLEVAQAVSELWPKTRIIFLTSADSFDYIYEVENLKNASYLLKIEPDEKIRAKVLENVKEILEEQRNNRLVEETNRKSIVLDHFLIGTIMKDLLYGHDIKEIEGIFSESKMKMVFLRNERIYLSLMQIEKVTGTKNLPNIKDRMDYIAIMESASDRYFSYALIEIERNLYLWILQPLKKEEEDLSFVRLKCQMEEFQERLYHHSHYYSQIIMYPKRVKWEDVETIYEKLYDLNYKDMKYRFQSVLIKYDSESDKGKARYSGIKGREAEQDLEELKYYLNKGDFPEYRKKVEMLKQNEYFRGGIKTNLKANTCYMSIVLVLVNFIEQSGMKKEISKKISLQKLFSLESYHSWREVFSYFDRVTAATFEIVEERRENKSQKTMRMIKEYIRDNLSRNITLLSISQVVCYNEAYISRIFKQNEGIGIFEYITLQRIHYAKNLLLDPELSIQEVAIRSGFSTSQYFSIVFKKKQGMTPGEYRNHALFGR